MNDKNEEKVVTNQSKNNKRRRFRPKNKPKQEGETTEQTSLASKSVIDNFFAAEQAENEAHAEQKSQNPRPKKQRNNKNQNKNQEAQIDDSYFIFIYFNHLFFELPFRVISLESFQKSIPPSIVNKLRKLCCCPFQKIN